MSVPFFGRCLMFVPVILAGILAGICIHYNLPTRWSPAAAATCAICFIVGLVLREWPDDNALI